MMNFRPLKAALCASLSVNPFAVAHAQTSLAQLPLGSAKSDGSITLETSGGFLQANFNAKSDQGEPIFKVGYLQRADAQIAYKRNSRPDVPVRHIPLYGLQLEVSPSGNVGSLFRSNSIATGARITFTIGEAYLASSLLSRNELDVHLSDRSLSEVESALATLGQRAIAQQRNILLDFQAELRASLRPNRTDPIFHAERASLLARARALLQQVEKRLSELPSASHSPGDNARPGQRGGALPPVRGDSSAVGKGGGNAQGGVVATGGTKLTARGDLIYDAWNTQIGFTRSSYELFDPKQAFVSQFSRKDFNGYSIQAAYNAFYGGRKLPRIFGVALGYARKNNAGELDTVTATDRQTIAAADGLTQRILESQRKGLQGDYRENSVMTLKTDAVFYPDLFHSIKDPASIRSTIAIDLFTRSTLGSGGRFVYGAGLYLTQPGNPLKVYGGVNVYKDTDNKLAVNLTTGFNF